MQENKTNIKISVILFLVVGLLLYAMFAKGGDLKPTVPLGPSMKTLNEIYDAIIAEGTGVSRREGHIQSLTIGSNTTENVLTVPCGKSFVLLKWHTPQSAYFSSLRVDEKVLIPLNFNNYHTIDFPDRCIVVNAGETLKIYNNDPNPMNHWIVGYFCNAK